MKERLNRLGQQTRKVSQIVGIDVIRSSSNISLPEAPLYRFFATITDVDNTKTPKHYSWSATLFLSEGESISNISQLEGNTDSLPGIYANESINNAGLLIGQIVECIYIPHLDFVIILNIIVNDVESYTVDIVSNLCVTFETKTFKMEGSPP